MKRQTFLHSNQKVLVSHCLKQKTPVWKYINVVQGSCRQVRHVQDFLVKNVNMLAKRLKKNHILIIHSLLIIDSSMCNACIGNGTCIWGSLECLLSTGLDRWKCHLDKWISWPTCPTLNRQVKINYQDCMYFIFDQNKKVIIQNEKCPI